MTIEIKIAGKTIRDLIEKQRTPETKIPKLDPILVKKILKKKEKPVFKYMDKKGVILNIGESYNGHTIHDIIICTYSKHNGKEDGTIGRTKVGDYLPVHGHRIIKPNGFLSNLGWNKFKNKYKFELVKKEKILTDEVMDTLIYNTDREYELMRFNHKKLITKFYKGIILETVKHVKNERLMTTIEDQENVVTALNISKYWSIFKDTDTNLGIYYANDSLNIVVWKYDDQWIITSNSSLLSIRTYLKKK